MQYLGMFVYVMTVLVFCSFMLLCGYFLGGRSNSRFKNVPFESGVVSIGNSRIKFFPKFYLVAAIFVIFDAEGIYLYIWSVSIRETGWIGFIEAFIFIIILLASLCYILRLGLFDWINKPIQYTTISSNNIKK